MIHWIYALYCSAIFAYTGDSILPIDRGIAIILLGILEFIPELTFLIVFYDRKKNV